jgi:hypothetical protein
LKILFRGNLYMDRNRRSGNSNRKTTVLEAENKFYKKLDQHKEVVAEKIEEIQIDTKEEINDVKKEAKEDRQNFEDAINKRLDLMEARDIARDKETKTAMQLLQAENAKLAAANETLQTLVIKHQTATTEGFTAATNANAAVHNQVNNLEKFVYLLAEQLYALQKLVREKAQQVAQEIDPKDIIAPPKESEIKMLEEALKDFASDDWQVTWIAGIKKLHARRLDTILNATIDCALTSYKIAATTKMLSCNDKASLIDSFLEAFTNAPNVNSSNTYLAIAGLLARTTIALVVTGYELRKLQQEKKALKRHFEIVTELDMKIMLKLLKEPTKEYFDKMVTECKGCYDVNCGRGDCSVGDSTGKGASYRRRFEKIPDFIQDCGIYTGISERIRKGVEANHDHIFDINIHLKEDITSEEREEFSRRFRLYRAINGTAEFESRKYCGEHIFEKYDKEVGVLLYGANCVTSVGLMPFLSAGKYYFWSKNATNLEKIILDCIIGCSPTTLKAIVRRADALARIQNIVETTKSHFIEESYDKCLKEMYSCIRKEPGYLETFIEAFDLYCRIKNFGKYNHNNYLCCEHKALDTPEQQESTYTNLIKGGLEKASDGFANIAKETTQTREVRKETINPDGTKTWETQKITLSNPPAQLAEFARGLAVVVGGTGKP